MGWVVPIILALKPVPRERIKGSYETDAHPAHLTSKNQFLALKISIIVVAILI